MTGAGSWKILEMIRFHKNLQKRLQAKKMASGGKSWIGQAFSLNDIGLEFQPEDFLGMHILHNSCIIYCMQIYESESRVLNLGLQNAGEMPKSAYDLHSNH